MNSFGQASLYILFVAATFGVRQVRPAEFIFGGEARRVCKAYKRVCSDGKVCALQTIDWPQNMKFPVCVYRQHKLVKSKVCKKAPQPGGCAARFTRWYYNIHMQACSWFTYSGCGGNKNNFRTFEECTMTCTSNNNIITKPDRGPRDSVRGNTVIESNGRVQIEERGDSINEVRRIPVPAPAPEVIDLTDDVTATLSLDEDPSNEEKNGAFVDKHEEKRLDDIDDDDDKRDDWKKKEEDKIAANLARKLRKQEIRRKRKLERERRRREKLMRQRKRELRKKRKRERSALNFRNRNSDTGKDVVSDIPGTRKNVRYGNNVLPTNTRQKKKFLDLMRRQNNHHSHHRPKKQPEFPERNRQIESRLIHADARRKSVKNKEGRQLTQLELGPYYQTGSSPLPLEKDLSMTSSDDSSQLGRYSYSKWLIDDRFGLRRSGESRRRRRGRVGKRRRERRRRRRIRKMNDARSANSNNNKVKGGNHDNEKDSRHNDYKDNAAEKYNNEERLNDESFQINKLHLPETLKDMDGSKVTFFDVLDGEI